MDFNLQKFPIYINGPDEDGLFDLAVPLSRSLISLLADGHGRDGMFSFMAAPPKFTKKRTPVALFLFVDNTRLATPQDGDKLFQQFNTYAARKNCHPVPVTLDFERRAKLYGNNHVTVRCTDSASPFPWNFLDNLLLLYAEDEPTAQQLFDEITT
jgi:hypothetical protein